MSEGSVVVLEYDGTNITGDVLWNSVSFEAQHNAVPGTFTYTVKDVNHVYTFHTLRETRLIVDGVPLFGGFVVQVEDGYPFAAMDTVNTDPDDTARYFTIRGLDYNMLFDRRVLRNPANYLNQIPNFTSADTAGELIRLMCSDYLDVPAGFDTDTYVDNIETPFNEGDTGAWMQQGTTWRKQMEEFVQFTAAVWYFDASRNLHHHAIESAVKRWGFSDAPNYNAITVSPATYQGATIGPREITATKKGDHKVHDALIWGGSPWSGDSGGTVFARETVTPPAGEISYQLAETHFGEQGYGVQDGVDARANIIVNGSPGAVEGDQQRGLKYDQWNVKFAWYAHQVPLLSGNHDHIQPGYITTITLETFETDSPLVLVLPMRSMRVSFPNLDPTGKGYVRFDGLFGLQPEDPYTLWRFLLRYRNRTTPTVSAIVTSGGGTTYGAFGSFVPTPVPNGAATEFTIPFGYIANTTIVYLFKPSLGGGIVMKRGIDYTESDPIGGKILFASPPLMGETLQVDCRTLNS